VRQHAIASEEGKGKGVLGQQSFRGGTTAEKKAKTGGSIPALNGKFGKEKKQRSRRKRETEEEERGTTTVFNASTESGLEKKR